MTGFGAEMRHINHRCRIIGPKLYTRSSGHRFQPLAQLQNGQGAQQPPGIEILVTSYPVQISGMLQQSTQL